MRYPDGFVAVRGVNLRVPAGQTVAVLGASGSGKSSLLRGIAGLEETAGSVRLGGVAITHLPTHKRGVGMVFQDGQLFPTRNVAHNEAEANAVADRIVQMPAGGLWVSQRKRLTVCDALLREAEPWLLALREVSGGEEFAVSTFTGSCGAKPLIEACQTRLLSVELAAALPSIAVVPAGTPDVTLRTMTSRELRDFFWKSLPTNWPNNNGVPTRIKPSRNSNSALCNGRTGNFPTAYPRPATNYMRL